MYLGSYGAMLPQTEKNNQETVLNTSALPGLHINGNGTNKPGTSLEAVGERYQGTVSPFKKL